MTKHVSEKTIIAGRPVDKSLQAFKDWIGESMQALKGADHRSELTEAQWVEYHKRFWEKANANKTQGS